ncbi:MAG: sigma-E factor negative regulatory protein [Cellvibrionaceae bacterium]
MSQSVDRKQLGESLSALVDDEASELEVHRVLAESQQDASVRQRWHRYQMARAALKGDIGDLTTTGFADRIRDAIAQTDFDHQTEFDHGSDQVAQGAGAGRWKGNAGRVAIAASVAAAVLVGSQQLSLVAFNDFGSEGLAQQPAQSAPSATTSAISIPTINVQNVSGGDATLQRSRLPQNLQYSPNAQQQQLQDEQIRRYIRQLMLEHAEHSAQNSGSGLLPYARVPAEDER